MPRERKRTVEVVSPGPVFTQKRLVEKHGVLVDRDERLAYVEAGEFWEFRKPWYGGKLRPVRRFQLVHRDRDVALDLSAGPGDSSKKRPAWSSGEVSAERRFELETLFGQAEYARLEQKKSSDRMFQAIAIAIILPAILLTLKLALRGLQPPPTG